MTRAQAPAVISLVGHSGSGKTTLIEQLLPLLARAGLRAGTAKHHHRLRALDARGTDSERHARAGALVVALSGPAGVIVFAPARRDPALDDLVASAAAAAGTPLDLFLAEGYTREARVAIQLRDATGRLRAPPRACQILAVLDLHARPPRAGRRPRFPAAALRPLVDRIVAHLRIDSVSAKKPS